MAHDDRKIKMLEIIDYCVFEVGKEGITDILLSPDNGEMSAVPAWDIWKGEKLDRHVRSLNYIETFE